MDEWMSTRAPVGTLHLSRFKDPIYFLLKPIGWKASESREGDVIAPVDVPVGFVTDFASIPRVFWSVLRPDGDYTYPAIIHDFLYWDQSRSRDISDEIFRLAMKDFGIDRITSTTIYEAVRIGGGAAWDENVVAKRNGEKRILKVFPDDPRVSWNAWKTRPGVFADG